MDCKHIETLTLNQKACEQANVLMLKHMDCIISKKEAVQLAEHVQECESCYEYYIAFDQAMEAMETASDIAPVGFTSAVMTEIRKMPVYTVAAERKSQAVLHVIWAFSAIVVVAALFFGYNPHYLTDLAYQYPIVDGFVNIASSIIGAFGQLSDAIMQDQQAIAIGSSFAIGALVFVFILSSLLVVLHKEEGIA